MPCPQWPLPWPTSKRKREAASCAGPLTAMALACRQLVVTETVTAAALPATPTPGWTSPTQRPQPKLTSFEHFAELFASAQPKSDADKALVAAYWVQVIEGQTQWGSRLLNTELKHLGYPLSNVTQALTTSIKRKPQLVIQLKKSGSSRQANKTYKVTNEGMVYVRGMINADKN